MPILNKDSKNLIEFNSSFSIYELDDENLSIRSGRAFGHDGLSLNPSGVLEETVIDKNENGYLTIKVDARSMLATGINYTPQQDLRIDKNNLSYSKQVFGAGTREAYPNNLYSDIILKQDSGSFNSLENSFAPFIERDVEGNIVAKITYGSIEGSPSIDLEEAMFHIVTEEEGSKFICFEVEVGETGVLPKLVIKSDIDGPEISRLEDGNWPESEGQIATIPVAYIDFENEIVAKLDSNKNTNYSIANSYSLAETYGLNGKIQPNFTSRD